MSTLSKAEERHFEAVGIDPQHVGEPIGGGAQNFVRHYRENEVVKVPLYQVYTKDPYSQTVGYAFGSTYDSVNRDLDLCREYFEQFLVDTDVRGDEKRKRFCIVQPKVAIHHLDKSTLQQNPVLQEQLEDLIERNRDMMRKQGLWLDVMGFNTAKIARFLLTGEPYMDNVVTDNDADGLKVIDIGIFTMRAQLQMFFQRWNMHKFGLEFGAK